MKTKILASTLLLVAGLFMGSCEDDNEYTIHSGKIISSIETGSAEVTAISATINGSVKDLSGQSATAYAVGVCYSTKEDPKTGTKATGTLAEGGSFSVTVGNLTKGVTYFYCSYVTLQNKVTYYGDVKSFTTTDAQVGTADAAAVTSVTATLGGTLNGVSGFIASGSPSLTYGVVVAITDSEEAVKAGKQFVGTGTTNSYSIALNALLPGTSYYYMAYMSLNGGYVFGEKKSFKTPDYEMEFVDMGLTVQWASCNLGAVTQEETGGLYGWGDVSGLKISADEADYGIANDITATEYDICTAVGIGRMPTFAEVNELITKCKQEWITVNGVSGYKFTARNGNTIFLPAAGYREESSIVNAGNNGYYWTGSINSNSTDYAYTMSFNNSSAVWGTSLRHQGLAIRPVKEVEVQGVKFDNYKLVTGDIEENGNFRMEIYNAYGATANNCGLGIPVGDLAFTDQLSVTFTISGITTPGEYQAFMAFADGDWSNSNWNYNEDGQASVLVTGNGTYTVRFNGKGKGLNVFSIDVKGLSEACGGAEGITATINNIFLDNWGTIIPFDNYKLNAGDIDSKANYRMEIYNAYGATANNCGLDVAVNDFTFAKKMAVTFTLSGITVPGEYKTYLAFADGSWENNNWSYNEDGQASVLVTGNGTYTVKFTGTGTGLNVYCVDVEGLVTACGGADGIIGTVDVIRVE